MHWTWCKCSFSYSELLDVSIHIDYTPLPGAVLGPNEYRAASNLFLTCQVEGATGTVNYTWDTTMPQGSGAHRFTYVLSSANTGTHTCTAMDENGSMGSDSVEVNVVGKFK